jgi:hypothetical protein
MQTSSERRSADAEAPPNRLRFSVGDGDLGCCGNPSIRCIGELPNMRNHQQTGQESCARHHVLYVVAWYIGYWFNAAAAVITAIATGFIAWFTWTLRLSTDNLWEASKKQIELARVEFLSTHRPRMRIKHIWLVHPTNWRLNQPLEVNLDIVNIGEAAAQVTWINYQTLILPVGERLPQRPPYDEVPEGVGIRISRFPTNVIVLSGVTLNRTVCDGILNQQDVHDILWGNKRLYLIGTVEYVHGAGLRQTAFCRRLTYTGHPPPVGDMGRFEVENDPDYEYED